MIEQTDSHLPNHVVVIQASKHRTLLPMRADDGVWVKGLDWYWEVHPVCGVPTLWIMPNPVTGLLEYRALKTLGQNPLTGLAGVPANNNEGWLTMRTLIAELVVMWLLAAMMICWLIGWYFNFAPQLGGFEIGGQTIYLPMQYLFWELRPQDTWVQKTANLLMLGFTLLAAYRFQRDRKRIIRPFNEGEMGNAAKAQKKGLFF